MAHLLRLAVDYSRCDPVEADYNGYAPVALPDTNDGELMFPCNDGPDAFTVAGCYVDLGNGLYAFAFFNPGPVTIIPGAHLAIDLKTTDILDRIEQLSLIFQELEPQPDCVVG